MRSWKPRDAIVDRKTGKLSLDLTLAEDFRELRVGQRRVEKRSVRNLPWELFEANDGHGTAYTNGRDWLCVECYDRFWGRSDFIAGLFGDMT